MDIFPGAYIARQAITASLMVGAIVVTTLSSRVESTLREVDRVTTSSFPYTTWLGGLTFFFEAMLVLVRISSGSGTGGQQDQELVEALDAGDLLWSAAVWVLWLVDVVCVTRWTWDCKSSPSACAKIGVLCGFTWVEWLLFTSRLIVIAAEGAKIRLSHMMQALQNKLTPWFKAAKEPMVQIAASLGVLLSGVVGSLGLLITGVVGVVDRLLDVAGLGGMRRRLLRSLGLDRMLGGLGVDKVLSGLGLGGLLGEPTTTSQGQGDKAKGGSKTGGLPIVGDLGLAGGSGAEASPEDKKSGGATSGGLPIVGNLGLGGGGDTATTATRDDEKPSKRGGGAGAATGGSSGGLPIVSDLGLGTSTATEAPPEDVTLRKRGGGRGGTSGIPLVGGLLEGVGDLGRDLGLGAVNAPAATPEEVQPKQRDEGVTGRLPVVGGLLGGGKIL